MFVSYRLGVRFQNLELAPFFKFKRNRQLNPYLYRDLLATLPIASLPIFRFSRNYSESLDE